MQSVQVSAQSARRAVRSVGTAVMAVAVATLSGAPAGGPVKFEAHDIDPKLPGAYAVNTADFNNDGKLDILYQDSNVASTGIHLALGNGNGTFQTPIDKPANAVFTSGPLSGLNFTGIVAGSTFFAVDLNGDGKVDIVDNQGLNSNAVVYLNTGSGFSLVPNPFPTQQFSGRFVFGDFNNDGYIDVLNRLATSAAPTSRLRQQGGWHD